MTPEDDEVYAAIEAAELLMKESEASRLSAENLEKIEDKDAVEVARDVIISLLFEFRKNPQMAQALGSNFRLAGMGMGNNVDLLLIEQDKRECAIVMESGLNFQTLWVSFAPKQSETAYPLRLRQSTDTSERETLIISIRSKKEGEEASISYINPKIHVANRNSGTVNSVAALRGVNYVFRAFGMKDMDFSEYPTLPKIG